MDKLIPRVLFRRDPRAAEVPLVFDSPHSGIDYPDDFRFSCDLATLRMAEDIYVDELYGTAPDHGATLIGALFPRSYLDCNRDLFDIDEKLFDEKWPGEISVGEKTKLGMGLVRRLARADLPVYSRKLTVAEVQNRIRTYYEPYHAELQEAVDRLHRKFGVVWHINCHSMQAEGGGMSSDPGNKRADQRRAVLRRRAVELVDINVLGHAQRGEIAREAEIVGIVDAAVRAVEDERHLGGAWVAAEENAGNELVHQEPWSLRWQAERRPGAIGFKGGACSRQIGIACGQRGWKWQPGGGAIGDGISPLTGAKRVRRRSRRGTSCRSACV